MASLTYSAVGNREDLIDVITNITPYDTPMMQKFGKATAKAMTHSWLTDSIAAAGVNKHLEDAEFVAAAATPRVKLDNNIQIFMKSYFVTESQEAVLKAGIKSEIAYQMAKAMKEIARDVEYAIVTSSATAAGDDDTPGQMGGIPYFNDQNDQAMGGAAMTAAGAEDKLNDAIQAAWEDGGNPEFVMCSGKNKRAISGFTAGAMKTVDMGDTKRSIRVDVYESDFGLVRIMAHRLQPNTRIDILETQYFKLAYLIPFKVVDLPKTGLKIAKAVSGQLTIECRTKNAHSAITGIAA